VKLLLQQAVHLELKAVQELLLKQVLLLRRVVQELLQHHQLNSFSSINIGI
jgi:hypothetical protein